MAAAWSSLCFLPEKAVKAEVAPILGFGASIGCSEPGPRSRGPVDTASVCPMTQVQGISLRLTFIILEWKFQRGCRQSIVPRTPSIRKHERRHLPKINQKEGRHVLTRLQALGAATPEMVVAAQQI